MKTGTVCVLAIPFANAKPGFWPWKYSNVVCAIVGRIRALCP